MASTRIKITHGSGTSDADVTAFLGDDSQPGLRVKRLADYLRAGAGGVKGMTVTVEASPVAASTTITCDQASAVAGTDEVTIGGFSCASVAASPTVTDGEWLVGASDTDMATNLAAAINGATNLKGIVTATSAAAVVTVTAAEEGKIGNGIELSETGSGLTLGASTLQSGDGGEAGDISTYVLGA